MCVSFLWSLISFPIVDLSLPRVCAIAVFVEPLVIPVRMIRRSCSVKWEKAFLGFICIPAFPAAVSYDKCKTKCNICGDGSRRKTKIHFAPFKVEINFSLHQDIERYIESEKDVDNRLITYYNRTA